MKILVTGNKGYIGSVLCGKLLEEGFEVIGLDAGFYEGCAFLKSEFEIRQIIKDVREISAEDVSGINAVIHLAALSNDLMGSLNPKLTSDINYLASIKIAKLAKENKVERFIFSSSCSIYGMSGGDMVDESGMLTPVTEYARSKVETEKKIAKLATEEFSPIFLRNATVYGVSPMLRVDLVVNNLVAWAHTTAKIKIMSDGTPWRPLIHIHDICQAFIAALKAPRKLVHNQTFNVGQNHENYQIKDIAETIKRTMPECSIEYTGEHGADTRTYRVDFSKINEVLKDYFKPSWNIKNGVEELLRAYRQVNLSKEDFLGNKFTRLNRIKYLLKQKLVDESLYWVKHY